MKKLFALFVLILIAINTSACGSKKADLLILNWGDYISDDLIAAFEEEYGVTVPEEEAVNIKTVGDIIRVIEAKK